MQPTEPAHRQHLVDLNLRLGMDKEALAEVESFLAVMDTGSHRTAAAQFLEEILADYPGQLEMRRHLADLYIRLDNREKAIEQLDLVADGLLTAERISETITVVETIINLDPPNAGEYRTLLAQLHANK
jgi:thioredoxin-like negative regulator of GroEL